MNDSKPCEHIIEFWKYCSNNKVNTYGCDCGGFVKCDKCNIEVDNSGGSNYD